MIWTILIFGLWCAFLYTSLSYNADVSGKPLCFVGPQSKLAFYLLQFTWGLPMNIIGGYIALAMLLKGAKKYMFGHGLAFELPGIDWGLSVGMFMIVPENTMNYDITMIEHEYGHALQNLYLGWFMPFVVFFPSIIRFWYRRIKTKLHKEITNGYLDIWFEQSASDSGEYFNRGI